MVDTRRYEDIDKYAQRTKQALDNGQFTEATNLWGQTEMAIIQATNNIDFYNILYKTRSMGRREESPRDFLYRQLLTRDDATLDALMNGHVKKTLNIPSNVTWGGQSRLVFSALYEDFMKPVTDVVEVVLNTTRLKVVVFTGQLDLIVDTPGTLVWADNLKWQGSNNWKENKRSSLVVNGFIEGYYKHYENFHFYWINRAGHMVPTDNPEAGIEMLRQITNYDEK